MKNRGVGCTCKVTISWTISEDIIVNIHCRDLREGATNVEKTKTFREKAKKFFPKDNGDDFMRAYRQIEGWLGYMGVEQGCHAYVIDNILKCSSSQVEQPFSLQLDVYVELTDVVSVVPKHGREEEEEEEEGVGHVYKKLKFFHGSLV